MGASFGGLRLACADSSEAVAAGVGGPQQGLDAAAAEPAVAAVPHVLVAAAAAAEHPAEHPGQRLQRAPP